MIFTEDFLFLHYPKTGGMMLTRQFLRKLKKEVFYTLPNGHQDPNDLALKLTRPLNILEGIRHENYNQAKFFLSNSDLPHRIEDFKCILLIIRNPYDYIVSRFHYLEKNQQYNKGPAARIAAEGDFRKYALNAPRFFKIDGYLLDDAGRIPQNMFVVRYEDFATQINVLMEKYLLEPIDFSKKINSTTRKTYKDYITDQEIEEAVYKKFKLLFDKGFYSRMVFEEKNSLPMAATKINNYE